MINNLLVTSLLISPTLGGFSFFEPFREQSNRWKTQPNLLDQCHELQREHETLGLDLKQREFELSPGTNFVYDGIDEVGLHARYN